MGFDRNLATGCRTTSLNRPSEVPAADWSGGGNAGASCAPVIGVATAIVNPSAVIKGYTPNANIQSSSIGFTRTNNSGIEVVGHVIPPTGVAVHLTATDEVLPDGDVGDVDGLTYINLTTSTLQAGDSVYGVSQWV